MTELAEARKQCPEPAAGGVKIKLRVPAVESGPSKKIILTNANRRGSGTAGPSSASETPLAPSPAAGPAPASAVETTDVAARSPSVVEMAPPEAVTAQLAAPPVVERPREPQVWDNVARHPMRRKFWLLSCLPPFVTFPVHSLQRVYGLSATVHCSPFYLDHVLICMCIRSFHSHPILFLLNPTPSSNSLFLSGGENWIALESLVARVSYPSESPVPVAVRAPPASHVLAPSALMLRVNRRIQLAPGQTALSMVVRLAELRGRSWAVFCHHNGVLVMPVEVTPTGTAMRFSLALQPGSNFVEVGIPVEVPLDARFGGDVDQDYERYTLDLDVSTVPARG